MWLILTSYLFLVGCCLVLWRLCGDLGLIDDRDPSGFSALLSRKVDDVIQESDLNVGKPFLDATGQPDILMAGSVPSSGVVVGQDKPSGVRFAQEKG